MPPPVTATGPEPALPQPNGGSIPIGSHGISSGRRTAFLPQRKHTSRTRAPAEYPADESPDEYGGEMGPNARVWRVYLEEADQYDAEMIDGFKDTTDVLLVFAGLFSAVVSTFLSQSAQNSTDYGQINSLLLSELVSLQRAQMTGSPISPSEITLRTDTTTVVDNRVNGMWFASLTLSLVAALIAVLVKQWLLHYISALSGTSRERVLIRHFRFMGLGRWKVPTIIGILPVLLHIALFMFFAGLVIFMWAQNKSIASVILAIGGISYIFYSAVNILAAIYPDCSYKSPVSQLVSYIFQALRYLRTRWQDRRSSLGRPYTFFSSVIMTTNDLERKAAEKVIDNVLHEALLWLRTSSSSPNNRDIVYFALAGVPFNYPKFQSQNTSIISGMWHRAQVVIKNEAAVDAAQASKATETLLRAFVLVSGSRYLHLETDLLSAPARLENLSMRSLVISQFSNEIQFADISSLLIDLVSQQYPLPPALWKHLFERDIDLPPPRRERLAPPKLVRLLLDVLKKIGFRELRIGGGVGKGANWNLPSSVELSELCALENRMVATVVGFLCRNLGKAPHADPIRRVLKKATQAGDTDQQTVVHLVLAVQDWFLAFVMSIDMDDDEESTNNILRLMEEMLFHLPAQYWSQPGFGKALHRYGSLCHIERVQNPFTTFSQQVVRQDSPAIILLYILDLIQHPWPLARSSHIDSPEEVFDLLAELFRKQDPEVFSTVVEKDALHSFRRCCPIDFAYEEETVGLVNLRNAFAVYVDHLAGCEEQVRKRHLTYLLQPDNLAWLMWLSCSTDINSPKPTFEPIKTLAAFNPSGHRREEWVRAAAIVGEVLRKDAATAGLLDMAPAYFIINRLFRELGLAGGECTLVGYASNAVYWADDSQYFRIVDPAPSLTGPFVVAFNPETTSLIGGSPGSGVPKWKARIQRWRQNLVRRDINYDIEHTPIK